MQIDTNSAVLLAYCCSRISECAPTESHQSKHGLFFLTLKMIEKEKVFYGARMFITMCTTFKPLRLCKYQTDKSRAEAVSYFDLQHIKRYSFPSQNG